MKYSVVILALFGALATSNAIKLEDPNKEPTATPNEPEDIVGKKAFKAAAEADRIAAGNLPGVPAEEGLVHKATQARFWDQHVKDWDHAKVVEAKAEASTKTDKQIAKE